MLRGHTETETCKLNGWTVGDIIEGDEGYGPTRIIITAIGVRKILACQIDGDCESPWTFACREWEKVLP